MEPNETDKIKEVLEEHEKRIIALERLFKSQPEKVGKKLSVKEFLMSKKPKDDVQKTLTIGYYLEKHENMKNFKERIWFIKYWASYIKSNSDEKWS